jgi:hypothetical protein
MHQAIQTAKSVEEAPLLSTGFLIRVTAAIALLAVLTIAISIGGRWFGARVSLAGNTDSTMPVTLTIGRDTLQLPENTLRFPSQRRSGNFRARRPVPRMAADAGLQQGKPRPFRQRRRIGRSGFPADHPSDDVARYVRPIRPIYSHLIETDPQPFANGMTLHRLRADAGYGDEVLLTAPRKGQPDYVVRCVLPAAAEAADQRRLPARHQGRSRFKCALSVLQPSFGGVGPY